MWIGKRNIRNAKIGYCAILILISCLGIGIYVNFNYQKISKTQIMFPEDSATIISEYQQEIQFIEHYTGTVIDEINPDILDCMIATTLAFKLDKLDTDLHFDNLNNSIVDAILKFKAFQMNSNVWVKHCNIHTGNQYLGRNQTSVGKSIKLNKERIYFEKALYDLQNFIYNRADYGKRCVNLWETQQFIIPICGHDRETICCKS